MKADDSPCSQTDPLGLARFLKHEADSEGKHAWARMHDADASRAVRLVVLAAVKMDGLALKHAVADFRADREIVSEAVKNNPHALKYAAQKVQGDRDCGGGCEAGR